MLTDGEENMEYRYHRKFIKLSLADFDTCKPSSSLKRNFENSNIIDVGKATSVMETCRRTGEVRTVAAEILRRQPQPLKIS